MDRDEKLQLALFPSYLAAIQNSIGSKLFRNLYFWQDRRIIDVLREGDLACAHFASFILYHFGLISRPHTTVKGVIKDLQQNGWTKILKPKRGAVIVYEEKFFPASDEHHMHIAFYIGNKKAVSNNSRKGVPWIHDWNKDAFSGVKRKPISIWWNKKLEQ